MDPRVPDQPDHRLKVFPKPTTRQFEAQVEIFFFLFSPSSHCSERAAASLDPRAHKGLASVERHETERAPATLAASPRISCPSTWRGLKLPLSGLVCRGGKKARALWLLFITRVQVCWPESGGVACTRKVLAR